MIGSVTVDVAYEPFHGQCSACSRWHEDRDLVFRLKESEEWTCQACMKRLAVEEIPTRVAPDGTP